MAVRWCEVGGTMAVTAEAREAMERATQPDRALVEALARELVDELREYLARGGVWLLPNDVMRWCYALAAVLDGKPLPRPEAEALQERTAGVRREGADAVSRCRMTVILDAERVSIVDAILARLRQRHPSQRWTRSHAVRLLISEGWSAIAACDAENVAIDEHLAQNKTDAASKPVSVFHVHLGHCKRCCEEPASPCPTGARLIREVVETVTGALPHTPDDVWLKRFP